MMILGSGSVNFATCFNSLVPKRCDSATQKALLQYDGGIRVAATDWLLDSLPLRSLYSMLVNCPKVKTTQETSDAPDDTSECPLEERPKHTGLRGLQMTTVAITKPNFSQPSINSYRSTNKQDGTNSKLFSVTRRPFYFTS